MFLGAGIFFRDQVEVLDRGVEGLAFLLREGSLGEGGRGSQLGEATQGVVG